MKKKLPIRIHFVCTGNIYRSRLAEAYLKSKNLPNVVVSSSGTHAEIQHKGPVSWYALRLLYRNNLLPFVAPVWTKTSADQLKNADLAVFIGKKNYDFCKQRFEIPPKYEVWDLPDFEDRDMNGKPLDIKREMAYIIESQQTFTLIQRSVDALIVVYHLEE